VILADQNGSGRVRGGDIEQRLDGCGTASKITRVLLKASISVAVRSAINAHRCQRRSRAAALTATASDSLYQ